MRHVSDTNFRFVGSEFHQIQVFHALSSTSICSSGTSIQFVRVGSVFSFCRILCRDSQEFLEVHQVHLGSDLPSFVANLKHKAIVKHFMSRIQNVKAGDKSLRKQTRTTSLNAALGGGKKTQGPSALVRSTSFEISRWRAANCIACSWWPREVCAFPRLQHARPSPTLSSRSLAMLRCRTWYSIASSKSLSSVYVLPKL